MLSQRAFLEPVKSKRCTTEPVELLNGINKDVCGAKLYRPIHLLNTHYCCLCLNGSLSLPLASHPPPQPPAPLPPAHLLIRAICDITVTVKKVAQNPVVLAS